MTGRRRTAGRFKLHPPREKASLSSSEEYLSRISAELTEEALFMACCPLNPVPIKKKQTQDQATQISTRAFFTKTRSTDTRSDRSCTRTKSHLLPAPREKVHAASVDDKAT
ncbi:putative protein T-ENOL isoform X2 [Aotus nancymaae]|uniref:putative protein T-ENOL isoform X2 n=1 Tax=Aotus nancymaae TaxID=37293 RepID=UPI000B50C180|nr:putative protein T-ENOL isoform X2 [Aotus nancymaae]